MKRHRRQRGSLWKSRGQWYLRFRDDELQPDGSIKRVQRAEMLAPVEGETRSKQSRILLDMVKERMLKINGPEDRPTACDRLLTISQFVEQQFFPMLKSQRRQTTY